MKRLQFISLLVATPLLLNACNCAYGAEPSQPLTKREQLWQLIKDNVKDLPEWCTIDMLCTINLYTMCSPGFVLNLLFCEPALPGASVIDLLHCKFESISLQCCKYDVAFMKYRQDIKWEHAYDIVRLAHECTVVVHYRIKVVDNDTIRVCDHGMQQYQYVHRDDVTRLLRAGTYIPNTIYDHA